MQLGRRKSLNTFALQTETRGCIRATQDPDDLEPVVRELQEGRHGQR
jgi:hypothetical protein